MKSTSIALPAPLKAWLQEEAKRRDVSMSAFATYLLLQAQEGLPLEIIRLSARIKRIEDLNGNKTQGSD